MSFSPQSTQPTDFDQVTILVETAERDFYRPNLDPYQPPDFPRLSGTDLTIGRIERHRLIMLIGETAMDPLSIARYLAWFLSDKLNHNVPSSVAVMEWNGLGGQAIDRAIERFKEPTIFILPHLKPQHVNHNLARLLSVLGDQHYVIVALEEI